MEISNIDFNVLKTPKFNKFFSKEVMSDTFLLLIYQYVCIVKKIKNIHPCFFEDKFYLTSDQQDTNVGKAISKVDTICKDILLAEDFEKISKISPHDLEKINDLYNLEEQMTTKTEEVQVKNNRITELEIEINHLKEKLLKEKEDNKKGLLLEKLTDEHILNYEKINYYPSKVKKESRKNAKKLGVKLDEKNMTTTEILDEMNNLFKKAKKTANKNILTLRKTEKKLIKKIDIIKNYEHFLDNLPENKVYKEYETQKIKEVKDEIEFILNQRENIIKQYTEKVASSFQEIHLNFLRYLDYINDKEEKLTELSNYIYGEESNIKKILDASNQKLLEFNTKINDLKKQKRMAILATEKMEKEYQEMRDDLSEEMPYYLERLIELNTASSMKDYYKYIKYKKYNAGVYKKIIDKHLFCECCKRIDQENLAGYKISPIVLDQLQKRGLDKIILFDIKNCSNQIEKLALKALCVLRRKFGGKSSIWYRHFISDKYHKYNKKNIHERFYYTFLCKEICDDNIDIADFINNKNKKLKYYKYYSKLDKEAGTKITISMLSKEEVKSKNKCDNDHLTSLTEEYFKMFFYKRFKKPQKENVSERLDIELKKKKLYENSKHIRTKKSHLEKKIKREGYIRKEEVLSFIKKEEEKGTLVPIIERVNYDIDLYEKTMEKIMSMVYDIPDIMDLTDEGVRMIIGDYRKVIRKNKKPKELEEYISDDSEEDDYRNYNQYYDHYYDDCY